MRRIYKNPNTCSGEVNFAANADLNEYGCVTVADFGLLSGNFGRVGDNAIGSHGPAPTLSAAGPKPAILALTVDQTLVAVDQTVTVTVEIDPQGAEVNGAMLHMSYDPALVEVVDVQLTDVLPITLLEPEIDSQAGTVRFAVGALGETQTDQFAVATLAVKVTGSTAGTDLTPVVGTSLGTDVTGPDGSVLGQALGLTLNTEQTETSGSTIFLPVVIK